MVAQELPTSFQTRRDGSSCSCLWSSRCWRCGRADASARWSPSSCLSVVRASETVEGRGRLYRSRRARDRAAEALRTASPMHGLSEQDLDAPAQGAGLHRHPDPLRGGGRAGWRRPAGRGTRAVPPARPSLAASTRPTCPSRWGGPGFSSIQQVLVQEQVGRVTNGLSWCLHTPPQWWVEVATDEQRERWLLPALPAASGTSATRSPRSTPAPT